MLLYLGCLLLPAVEYDNMSSRPHPELQADARHLWHQPIGQIQAERGYFHLALGWIGIILPPQVGALGWLANPAYFLAFAASRRGRATLSRVLGLAALALAACSLVLFNLEPMQVLLHDPVSQFWSALRPLAGFWIWIGAIALMNVYAFQAATAPTADQAKSLSG